MKYILSITTLFISTFAFGQSKVLTLAEAVKIALENNVTLKQQQNQQYINQAQKNSSLASVAPSINAFAQAWRVQGNQFIEQEARVVNDAQTSNLYGTLDASMPLFNGFRNMNSILSADAALDAQEFRTQRTRQDVITQVSNQYLRCLLDKELLKISEENLNNQEVQHKQIAEMVTAGSRAKVDEYNQVALVKSAELAVLRAEIQLRRDKAILSQTLAMDPEIQFELAQPDWNINNDVTQGKSLEQLYADALNSRGDLRSAQENMKAAKKNVSVSRTVFMPSISAYGSLNSRYSDASIPSVEMQMDDNLRKEYGLRLRIPIFAGLQNNVSYVRAKVNYSNSQLQAENTEIVVKSDVLNTYQNYKDAELSFEASQAQLEAASASFALEEERYELGVSDLASYTQANQLYFRAKGDAAQATFTLLFQKILLDYALGTLSVDDIP